MNKKNKQRLSWSFGASILALFVGWAFWPRPAPVDLGTVTRGPMMITLDEEGETRVRERYSVSAPVAGRVLRIELEPGDPVRAGETVLAIFQPARPTLLDARGRAEAEARVRAAEADHEAAKHQCEATRAELDFARIEFERISRLAEEDVLPAERLDTAQLAERQAAEAFEAAEHSADSAAFRLVSARARLLELGAADRRGDDPILLRSPIDGVVLRLLHESEGVVRAGETLLELGDPSDLEIVADFLSSDAVRIKSGAPVIIERWGGDVPIEGRVERVEPSGFTKISALGVEEQRVNVIVDLAGTEAMTRGLGDGFRVETRVVVWSGEDVLQIPSGSLFRTGDAWSVYRLEEGRARSRSVTIGGRTPTLVEVKAGLEVGDRVIRHPGDNVLEATRVEGRQ